MNKAFAATDTIASPITLLGFDETGLRVQTLREKCNIEDCGADWLCCLSRHLTAVTKRRLARRQQSMVFP